MLIEVEMQRREKENLRRALRQTGWKVYGPDGAAELLGVKPTTLVSRIKKLKLKADRADPSKHQIGGAYGTISAGRHRG